MNVKPPLEYLYLQSSERRIRELISYGPERRPTADLYAEAATYDSQRLAHSLAGYVRLDPDTADAQFSFLAKSKFQQPVADASENEAT